MASTGLGTDPRYRAISSRDARFDGQFFVGVTTTGIYCRPSCPARTPKPENVQFFTTAASAQRSGFRACMRCRPDSTPGSPEWNYRSDTTARAMRLINAGALDDDNVESLAQRLGYSSRHLTRLLTDELGAGPLALARAQRAHTARTLIETTPLPFADIAFAAGFSSIRQFNDTVHEIFAATPSALRTSRNQAGNGSRVARHPNHSHENAGGLGIAGLNGTIPSHSSSESADVSQKGGDSAVSSHGGIDAGGKPSSDNNARHRDADGGGITVRLAYRPPLAAGHLFGFLAARAIYGLEEAGPGFYRRSMRLLHGSGVVEVRLLHESDPYVSTTLHLMDLRDLTRAVYLTRRLLDLDADPTAITDVLITDTVLAPQIAAVPGLRLPGAVDGFEIAVRAIVGQQVSVAAARTILGRLVADYGEPLAAPMAGVRHVFPTPTALATIPLSAWPMPRSRAAALQALCAAVDAGDIVLDVGADPTQVRQLLQQLPGIGPWTASYIVMRALGSPDEFLETDLGIRRGARTLGFADSPALLREHAERWRPFRSYAALHLWAADSPFATQKETVR